MSMTSDSVDSAADHAEIIRLVQNWGFLRDDGFWNELLDCYTPDGRMATSWSDLSAADFVKACRQGMNQRKQGVLHAVGAGTVAQRGDRAIAQTRLTILLRGELHGVEVDVTCHGRSYDHVLLWRGQWKIHRRYNIYERSRIDPVVPGTAPALDPDLLAQYPASYRHLAYFQVSNGARVPTDLPAPDTPSLARLLARGEAWLEGGDPDAGAGQG